MKKLDYVLALSLRQALSFVFLCLLMSSTGFILGQPLSHFYLPIALLLVLALSSDRIAPPGDKATIRFAASSLLLIVFAVSVGVSSRFLDSSYDGNAYHLVSIIGLRDGWNPVRMHSFVDWAAGSHRYTSEMIEGIADRGIWTDHFPKASWTLAALVLMWVPKLACASWVQLFFGVFAALSFRQGLRWAGIRSCWATPLSVSAAMSPVMLAQLFTNYVDGLLGSCLLIQVGLLLAAHNSGRASHILEAGMAAVVASNLKFTGMVYSVLLLTCFVIISKSLRQTLLEFGRNQPWRSSAGVAAAILICWNPYFTNLLVDGHPFHPLEKTNIIAGQADPEFLNKSRWVKFWGASTGALSPRTAEADAVPFWAERPGLWRYHESIAGADKRMQGLGPHFVLILSMALCVGAHAAWQLFRTRKECTLTILALVYLIWLGSCMLLNPEFWWARYLPQLWIFPFVMCALSLAAQRPVAAIALAVPLMLSTLAFGLYFVLLTKEKVQMEHRVSDVLVSKGVLRVATTERNSRFLFVATAVAAEHGTRFETIPNRECQALALPRPMIMACAP